MHNKKLSIIMSVYKNDNLNDLKESLNSLYSQTYQNFDTYIQCDGLLTNSLYNYLDNEFKKNKIILYKRDENKGLAYSLNELLEIVMSNNYEFIARMDADDICDKKRLEKQYQFMKKNKSVDVCGSDIMEFYDDGSEKYVKYPIVHGDIKKGFSKRTAIPHVTAFFRKSFFEKSNNYNIYSNKNEDQWLWLNGFLNNCQFASISEPLVKVRLSKELLIRRKDLKHLWDTYKLRNQIINKLNFSPILYIYNIIIFFVKMMPSKILKLIYKYRK